MQYIYDLHLTNLMVNIEPEFSRVNEPPTVFEIWYSCTLDPNTTQTDCHEQIQDHIPDFSKLFIMELILSLAGFAHFFIFFNKPLLLEWVALFKRLFGCGKKNIEVED
jgi:hypothetical protein